MSMRDSIEAARIEGPEPLPDAGFAFAFRFQPDDPTFAGHFPTRPLLPGVFQLEMVRAAAEWTLNCPLSIREVPRAKFSRPIGPSERIRLELHCSESGGDILARAELSVEGRPAGESILCLRRR